MSTTDAHPRQQIKAAVHLKPHDLGFGPEAIDTTSARPATPITRHDLAFDAAWDGLYGKRRDRG
jgi:hypothetical protein